MIKWYTTVKINNRAFITLSYCETVVREGGMRVENTPISKWNDKIHQ